MAKRNVILMTISEEEMLRLMAEWMHLISQNHSARVAGVSGPDSTTTFSVTCQDLISVTEETIETRRVC